MSQNEGNNDTPIPSDTSGDPGSDSFGGSLEADDAPESLFEASGFFGVLLCSALTIPFNVASPSTGFSTIKQERENYSIVFMSSIFPCQPKYCISFKFHSAIKFLGDTGIFLIQSYLIAPLIKIH